MKNNKLLHSGRLLKRIVLKINDFEDFRNISVTVNPNLRVHVYGTDIEDTVLVEGNRVSFMLHKEDLEKYVEIWSTYNK
jgi:hypothetical protein